MTAPLRVGVIGAGQISWGACREFAGDDRVSLLALADPSTERCAELADAVDIPHRHTSGEDLIGRDDLDAVYVATPECLPCALGQAGPGKRQACAGRQTIRPQSGRGPRRRSGSWRQDPDVGHEPTFQSGRRPWPHESLLVNWVKFIMPRPTGVAALAFPSWVPGSAKRNLLVVAVLLDIGVHMLDLAMYVTGRFDPVSVSGQAQTRFGNRGLGEGSWGKSDRDPDAVFDVDDFATALIKFSDGFHLQSRCHLGPAPRS